MDSGGLRLDGDTELLEQRAELDIDTNLDTLSEKPMTLSFLM
jgi:hypothetical protein